MYAAVSVTNYDGLFQGEDMTDPMWVRTHRPSERAGTIDSELDWSNLALMELFAGQHREEALRLFIQETDRSLKTDFIWIINIYDIDHMPHQLRIDMISNAINPRKPQSAAEIYRDMHAILEDLTAADQTVIRPILQRTPSVAECLNTSKKGDQAKIEEAFANALGMCASTRGSLDKYRSILSTPIRDEVARWCNSALGRELFSLGMGYEMAMSVCFDVCLAVACKTVMLTQ